MAQIQNAGPTTWAAFSRNKWRPCLTPMIEAYSWEYRNVQNQNLWKLPAARRARQVTAKGRTVPNTKAPALGAKSRQSSRPSRYSLLTRYRPPKTANIIPGCFIRKANPSSTPLQKKSEECGCGVDEQQTQMNGAGRLPEDRENHRIRSKGPGQLHAVNKLVRRYALQEQLPRIGVFALVPFQGALP